MASSIETNSCPPVVPSDSALTPPTEHPSSVSNVVASRKSKKKKTLVSTSGDQGVAGENTGRWTAEEHRLFLQGLEQHGKGWKKIASLIKSRTVVQIRTHAQKYFQKLAKARQNGEDGEVTMEGRGGLDTVASTSSASVATTIRRQRQIAGTKRRVIQSVVASALRQKKRLATANVAPKTFNTISPILVDFMLPEYVVNSSLESPLSPTVCTFSSSVLEDSL